MTPTWYEDERRRTSLADRIRANAVASLIACKRPTHTPRDESARLWVFRENAHRLEQLWAGVLNRPESEELIDLLLRAGSVWLGGIDTLHAPPIEAVSPGVDSAARAVSDLHASRIGE